MNLRSDYILGKYTFIKKIKIDNVAEYGQALLKNKHLPFLSKEISINYLIDNVDNLLSPKTKVLYKTSKFGDLSKIMDKPYSEVLNILYATYEDFSPEKIIASKESQLFFLIVSERVTGNFDDFLNIIENNNYEKEIEDALIHICYLYYIFQKKYACAHLDSKLANHTWLKLDRPIDITYDFRDNPEDSPDKIIIRKGVKNLFYLTDLEFVYSPIIKKVGKYYFNFSKIYDWMSGNIYVPKLSIEDYWNYNKNLYLGAKILDPISKISNNGENIDIKKIFGVYPRIFSIDILSFMKTILEYDYIENLPKNISRKINMFFSMFSAISKAEGENMDENMDYEKVSPTYIAILFNK